MRFSAIFSVLAAGIFCQGCVVFPYPTPEVRGSVIDATTKKPIADARIAVHNHFGIYCKSAADGSFDLPAGNAWRPCPLIPGDIFVSSADVSFKADGYQTVIRHYATGFSGTNTAPVVLEQPVGLQKETRP